MNEPLGLHMLGLQLCTARLFTSPASEHRLIQQDKLRESLDSAAHLPAHPYLISIHTCSLQSFRSSLRFCCWIMMFITCMAFLGCSGHFTALSPRQLRLSTGAHNRYRSVLESEMECLANYPICFLFWWKVAVSGSFPCGRWALALYSFSPNFPTFTCAWES